MRIPTGPKILYIDNDCWSIPLELGGHNSKQTGRFTDKHFSPFLFTWTEFCNLA